MTPQELLIKMDAIEYGCWDWKHNKKITPDDKQWDENNYIYDNCCVLKPNEVWSKLIGTCYDQTLLEFQELINYKIQVIYYEKLNRLYQFGTHATLIYQDVKDKFYYWFEHSWFKMKGIHGPFESKLKAIEFIKLIEMKMGTTRITYFNSDCNEKFKKLLKLHLITFPEFDRIVRRRD